MNVKPTKLYRYDDNPERCNKFKPSLSSFTILRDTPCFWVIRWLGNPRNEKRIAKQTQKKFAYISKDKAIYNYERRKNNHIEILKARLELAETSRKWIPFLKEELSKEGIS